ncbi:MAG: amino acid adenylation domain-containing protein, partial [bacterium]|nr:amino acid adenylation domain-containing protein [bacterium]
DDIFLQQASFSFDVFVEEVFPILLTGGRSVMVQREVIMDIDLLSDFMLKQGITIISCSPLLLNQINNVPDTGSIRIFINGGDVLKREYVSNLLKTGGVYNTYGPTESTVCATYYRCLEDGPANPPIGKPIANYSVYILGNDSRLLPIGVPGELCVAGAGVSRGYLNRPELTDEKFTTGEKLSIINLYRTGDLAKWLPDGNVEFLGRIDHQVKIRGYRIELGEIENRLLTHPEIKDAVVAVRENENGDRFLCAYLLPAGEEEFASTLLKDYLSEHLPDYMIPTCFVSLDRFPLTPTGKVDRRMLPEPEVNPGQAYIAPRDEVEKQLAGIWSEILEVEEDTIGIDSDFFQLGGFSWKATLLISRVHQVFNVKVPLLEVFHSPTIRELSRYIKGASADEYVSIDPVEKREYYALSSAQRRLFLLRQMDIPGTLYNISQVIPSPVDTDPVRLLESLDQLIARHESLRTSFHMIDDRPVQRVHDHVEFRICRGDPLWSPLNGNNCDVNNNHLGSHGGLPLQSFIHPFDLSRAPLMRAYWVTGEGGDRRLVLDMHHIISDGVSLEIVMAELTALYSGETLPPLTLQYKDFARWQTGETHQQLIRDQETYWLNIFSGEPPVLQLPIDYPRPAVQSFDGSRVRFGLDEEQRKILDTLADEGDTTLYMVILAVLNLLLAKLTRQEDIIVGTPVAGRRHIELEGIVGMFVNTLVLRNYPSGGKTFKEFLNQVMNQGLEAFENQEYQFEDLVDQVSVNRDTGRNPLFDVMFSLVNAAEAQGELARNREENFHKHREVTAKFDLTFTAIDMESRLIFTLEYCTKLFKPATIERIITYFKTVVNRLSTHAHREIAVIEIITSDEKRLVLHQFNDTRSDYPADKTIHQLFEEQEERTPDHIALVGQLTKGDDASLTYTQLNEKASQLASRLCKEGVAPDTIVAIMMERSIEMLIGIFGILKAGGAYLPIDPDYPEERINFMLKDSGTNVLVSWLDGLLVRRLNASNESTNKPSNQQTNKPTNLAYIIYTSGSTGQPKGVLTTHANTTRVVLNTNYIKLTAHDRVLQWANYAFDGSVFDIYGALLNGAVLLLLSGESASDVARLAGVINKQSVTAFFVTTALFNVLVDEVPRSLAGIRKILFGGELVSVDHARRALEQLGIDKILHMYGPTETTVYATWYKVNQVAGEAVTIPIGQPLSNTTVYILDNYNRPLPIGLSGEIFIGGSGTARGYLNRPELTAERFIANPYLEKDRLYKTGDFGRWLSDGNIEFLGRVDHQVKIRGFRVELAEIEIQLLNHHNIKEALVVARDDVTGGKHLCAYVVPVKGDVVLKSQIAMGRLRDDLSGQLPEYMIPSYFVALDAFSLNPQGKIDRKSLPTPHMKAEGEYIAPRDEIEKKLAAIWADILGIEKSAVSLDSGFFQLGGNSLKAAILNARIHKEFNVMLRLVDIFKEPRLKGMGEYIRGSEIHEFTSIEAVEEKEYYELSYNQERLWIIHRMDPQSPAYNLPGVVSWEHPVEEDTIKKVLSGIVARHESFRTWFAMVNEQPVQFVADRVDIPLEMKDISAVDPARKMEQRTRIIGDMMRQPFDLGRAPLSRFILIKVEEERYDFVFNMHHIISDGSSMEVLKDEFSRYYWEYKDRREPDPGKPGLQYKSFARWQKEQLRDPAVKENAQRFWQRKLSGTLPELRLPRYVNESFDMTEFASWNGDLKQEAADRLKRVATDKGISTFMLFFAGVNTLLAWLSGQKDIICGLLTAGREHAALQNIVGFFVNTLILKHHVDMNDDFNHFLQTLSADTLESLQHQGYPLELVFDDLDMKYPDIPVMFNMVDRENAGAGNRMPGEGVNFKDPTLGGKFDISFHVFQYENRTNIRCAFRKRLFRKEQMEHLLKQYLDLMEKIAAQPDQKIESYFSIKKKRRL